MKILYVLTALTGGTNSVNEDLIKFFKKNHSVFVLIGYEDYFKKKLLVSSFEAEGVCKTFLNLRGQFNVNVEVNYWNREIDPIINAYLEKVKPDIIHLHSINAIGVSIINIAKERHIPIVFTMHDFWITCPLYYFDERKKTVCDKYRNDSQIHCCLPYDFMKKRTAVLKLALNNIDIITVPSKHVGDVVNLNFQKKYPIVIVEHNLSSNLPDTEDNRKSSSSMIRFGFLGGINQFKGLPLILNAAWHIREPFTLKIAGITYVENPFTKKYNMIRKAQYLFLRFLNNKSFVVKLGLILSVHFLKFFKKNIKMEILKRLEGKGMENFYKNIDVLLLPSIMPETYSILVREALVHKTPVIVSKCGGPEDAVEDSINGFLININDVGSLLNKMSYIIKNPSVIDKLKKGINSEKLRNDPFANLQSFSDIYNRLTRK